MGVSSTTKSFQSELNCIEMKSDQTDAEVSFSGVNCGGLSKLD